MMLDNYVLTGRPLDFLVSFVAGFVTFFASCLLPLVPTYLAYLSGLSFSQLSRNEAASIQSRLKVFRHGLFFVAGFVLVFVIFGATSVKFAAAIMPYRLWIERLGGTLFVAMGLSMLGLIKTRILNREFKLDLNQWQLDVGAVKSFLTGVVFAAGWTPCIGPVLAVLIYWAGHSESAVLGGTMLLIYGLGLGTPFLLIGLLFDKIVPWLSMKQSWVRFLSLISGLIVLLVGMLLLFNHFQTLAHFLLSIFNLNRFSM